MWIKIKDAGDDVMLRLDSIAAYRFSRSGKKVMVLSAGEWFGLDMSVDDLEHLLRENGLLDNDLSLPNSS